MKIVTTKEKVDEAIKFAMITTLKYCISNELDFSMGIDEDESVVASNLYEEMFSSDADLSKQLNQYIK